MTYPTDPVAGPQVVLHEGHIYRRAFGETTWWSVSPEEAERLAGVYEATTPGHWAYAHEQSLAVQLRDALSRQSQQQEKAA